MNDIEVKRKRIRRNLVMIIIGLILSGISALPIESLLSFAAGITENWNNLFSIWIGRVYLGVRETNISFPFMSYGTDWLAFAHFVIAILFVGPLRDPQKNIWVIEFGMVASVLIIPFAFVAGAVREIPLFWRIIDCSFGVFAGLILYNTYCLTKSLERTSISH